MAFLTQEERDQRVRQLTDRLEAGISDLFQSERYAGYLRAMSKLHRYSFKNSMLIFLQRPDASMVAGFQDWRNKFGRQVKKGERGIQILAPCPYRRIQELLDPQTGQPVLDDAGNAVMAWREATRFKVVTVFDVSQTEGRALPTLGASVLQGDVDGYDRLIEALTKLSPLPVEFADLPGSEKGYCSHLEGRVVVRSGMSQTQTVKTLVHEIVHAMLHEPQTDGKPRSTRELEAESTAYVVCRHFGIDTSEYSFGYVAGWSRDKDMKQLKASLDLIRSTASGIIGRLEDAENEPVPCRRPRSPRQTGAAR